MQQIKLANIIVEHNDRSAIAPGLYCKSVCPVLLSSSQEGLASPDIIVLPEAGLYDFMTYFNSFSNHKWRMYTNVGQAYLHMQTKGQAYTLQMVYANDLPAIQCDYDSEGLKIEVPASKDWISFDVPLPTTDDVLIGFNIQAEGQVSLTDAYYFAEVADEDINKVELALCTTTFKKEEYILPNIALVKEQVLGSGEDIAQHFTLHVVDNGRTLDVEGLEQPGICIHPNPNAGGSGGYARGMIEAMEQDPQATHALLMDDDVSVCPESIFRTYRLLTLLRPEYRDAFVSGAMFEYGDPSLQFEDVGYIDDIGQFRPAKVPMNMNMLRNLVSNETFEYDRPMSYAGWWYCVIPMRTIQEKGLPLPLFVRSDDTEYGVRCAPRFVTMNGICIWHEAFHEKYSATVERYQTNRNKLIANAVSGMGDIKDILFQFEDGVRLELKKFNYTNALITVEAMEDYLKGPDFIMTPGVVEEKFMEKNRECEKLVPLNEIEEIRGMHIDAGDVYGNSLRSWPQRLMDLVTFNGQRMPYPSFSVKNAGGDMRIIPSEGWGYPDGRIRGAEELLAVDIKTGKGVLRKKDPKRYREVRQRYKKAMKEYDKRKDELREAYAAKMPEMTSVAFWKEYLGK